MTTLAIQVRSMPSTWMGKSTEQLPATVQIIMNQGNTPNTRPEVDCEQKVVGSTSVDSNSTSTINIRDEAVVGMQNESVRIFIFFYLILQNL